jgi:hypothetical protein
MAVKETLARITLLSVFTDGSVLLEVQMLQGQNVRRSQVRVRVGMELAFFGEVRDDQLKVSQDVVDLLKSISHTPPKPDITL